MKRPPKPRISKPRLVWKLNRQKTAWVPYHRVTWTEEGRSKQRAIKLDWQDDTQLLDELYWRCEAGRHEKQAPKVATYTWERLIKEWKSDPRIQSKLAASTKLSYARDMDRILEKNALKDVRKTTKQGLRAAHSKLAVTPRKADKYVTVVKLLWNYGRSKLDWPLGANPAEGIDLFGRQKEYEPWPEWMVEKLADAPPMVRTAAEIILGTGQRPSAAVKMRFDQFNGKWMTVRDEKRAEDFEVYCPPALRSYVESLKKNGAHILAKNLTEPLGYNAIEKRFRAWRKDLGDAAAPYTLHGLRKLAIIRLAEAGATDAEIQAITNQSAEMVAFYRKRASRKTLSRAARLRSE
ncbi:tyrosine-type recombinase/integrase [Phaeobacter sp. CNT1-3]|nr:tyrosine-type recombinase/integrase [Phaeobacter sp. CNT1-3]